ncbi:bifunctional sulfur transferase/dioxygenase Blh [Allorhizobium sp. BGMRC 0089]|uniref:bifunctional sulfur transferase/dioxygenase Blh n=1 Tax=Allorhizobium sonneratiae TaxID=2934936 RepID=UPI002033480E|nr:bifunctional sulfur transferase/dioxygenase Blh [Allorhizobium sonneratiae]MCM2292085.1 bifunctional sulfur transferase/dioxygenase Blh [Allorhizobium sonneratiae]
MSHALSQTLTIGPQLTAAEIAALPEQGYKAVINLRPDAEEGALGNKIERRASDDAGLAYRFLPVTMDGITEADIDAFRVLTAENGPVFAHCGTGRRALMLHVLASVLDGRMSEAEVLPYGAQYGMDLQPALDWLARHATKTPQVKGFFDPRTWSVQYVVSDPKTKLCAIIDPVLDYDEKSGQTSTENADRILAYIAEKGLTVEWILDTHPHADHFSAAHYLKGKTAAKTAIGDHVVDVQALWKGLYNWPELVTDGSQWDHLFHHGETFKLGAIDAKVLFSPGHTLASITYVIGDAAFVHDTLFMPDSGTARADFPGGDAHMLWRSMADILALPDDTRIFTGHDYQPGGRQPRWESTVAEQKAANPHIAGVSEESFVALRQARDRTLPMPKLILHALQVNVRGGRLPEPENNGRRYLKIPLDTLEGAAW